MIFHVTHDYSMNLSKSGRGSQKTHLLNKILMGFDNRIIGFKEMILSLRYIRDQVTQLDFKYRFSSHIIIEVNYVPEVNQRHILRFKFGTYRATLIFKRID